MIGALLLAVQTVALPTFVDPEWNPGRGKRPWPADMAGRHCGMGDRAKHRGHSDPPRSRFRAGNASPSASKGILGMLNLAEYRSRADRIADHLPWAALVAPGVVLNKDGSFQRTFRFRGPDLESATEAELVAACARANNVLKRLGSGWAIFFEAHRREAQGYPDGNFADPASWLVDQERRAQFAAHEQHFESVYHATFLRSEEGRVGKECGSKCK